MREAIALFALLVLAGFLRWCFGPHSRLPRFRVTYLRLRLRLRLHPGRGHATVFQLWLRWGRLASFRRSRRSRPSLSIWRRLVCPDEHSLAPGRATPAPATSRPGHRPGTKTAAFLELVERRHGPLAGVPVTATSQIASEIAPQVGLNTGAARTALRRAVLAAREEGKR